MRKQTKTKGRKRLDERRKEQERILPNNREIHDMRGREMQERMDQERTYLEIRQEFEKTKRYKNTKTNQILKCNNESASKEINPYNAL